MYSQVNAHGKLFSRTTLFNVATLPQIQVRNGVDEFQLLIFCVRLMRSLLWAFVFVCIIASCCAVEAKNATFLEGIIHLPT